MTNLTKEYTDIRDIKHNVEHLIISSNRKNDKEQILEELFHALTRSHKQVLHNT